jgi:heme/copper-type cytochrome/quinol oxidase subunit 4
VKVDRELVFVGLPLGPLLTLIGYLVLMQSGATITDTMLVGLVIFPTALVLLGAALATVLHLGARRWVSIAVGTAVGTAVAVVIVGGGISLIAWMLSDPA